MLEGLQQLFVHPIPSDVLGWSAFVIFLISVFVDVSKVKLNPWKRVLRGISSVFNAELMTSQKELKAQMDRTCEAFRDKHNELAEQLDTLKHESLVWQKRTTRRKIIEFADECRRGVRHSQQMYLNVFDDISEYDQLCKATKDPNHVVTESVNYIKEMYHDRLERNDFI